MICYAKRRCIGSASSAFYAVGALCVKSKLLSKKGAACKRALLMVGMELGRETFKENKGPVNLASMGRDDSPGLAIRTGLVKHSFGL